MKYVVWGYGTWSLRDLLVNLKTEDAKTVDGDMIEWALLDVDFMEELDSAPTGSEYWAKVVYCQAQDLDIAIKHFPIVLGYCPAEVHFANPSDESLAFEKSFLNTGCPSNLRPSNFLQAVIAWAPKGGTIRDIVTTNFDNDFFKGENFGLYPDLEFTFRDSGCIIETRLIWSRDGLIKRL